MLPVALEARPAAPLPSGRSVIEFRGVSKRYPSGDTGLDQATFAIERGEWVFLVGSTGSGKSTVMRLLRQIPWLGPIRVALEIALMQTQHRFRTKR